MCFVGSCFFSEYRRLSNRWKLKRSTSSYVVRVSHYQSDGIITLDPINVKPETIEPLWPYFLSRPEAGTTGRRPSCWESPAPAIRSLRTWREGRPEKNIGNIGIASRCGPYFEYCKVSYSEGEIPGVVVHATAVHEREGVSHGAGAQHLFAGRGADAAVGQGGPHDCQPLRVDFHGTKLKGNETYMDGKKNRS